MECPGWLRWPQTILLIHTHFSWRRGVYNESEVCIVRQSQIILPITHFFLVQGVCMGEEDEVWKWVRTWLCWGLDHWTAEETIETESRPSSKMRWFDMCAYLSRDWQAKYNSDRFNCLQVVDPFPSTVQSLKLKHHFSPKSLKPHVGIPEFTVQFIYHYTSCQWKKFAKMKLYVLLLLTFASSLIAELLRGVSPSVTLCSNDQKAGDECTARVGSCW